MEVRTLGRSGVPVTRLGLGTGPLGNLWREISDDEAAAAVDAAWDAGVRYFDTAPHYGVGLAERRLGEALRRRPREEATVSTKVGRRLVPREGAGQDLDHVFRTPATHDRVWDFSADGVRRTLEDSLERLGLDRVDVVLLHDVGLADPPDHLHQAVTEGFPALAELRSQGVVGAVGAGMAQVAELTHLVRETDLDVVMLAGRYTLLDQSGADEVLPACAERGVTVLAAAPFASGVLARVAPEPGSTFDYAEAPGEVLARAQAIAAVCALHDVELPQAALHLPLAHPTVAGVVVGLQTAAEVDAAVTRLARPVPADLWTDLRERGLLEHAPT